MKKIITIVLGLIIFLLVGTWILNTFVFPTTFKKIIKQNLEDNLNRRVEISTIYIHLFRGIVAEEISVFEKDTPGIPLLTVKNLSFSFLYWPFGKQKQIILPQIHIQQPSLRIVRKNLDVWNFSDLISSPRRTKTQGSPAVIFGEITVNDATISIIDEKQWPAISEVLGEVDFKAHPTLTKQISFSLKINSIKSSPDGLIEAQGTLDPKTMEFSLHPKIKNIRLNPYLSYLKLSDLFTWTEGTILAGDGMFSSENKAFHGKGKIKTQNMKAKLSSGPVFSGNPTMTFAFSLPHDKKENLDFKVLVDPDDTKIESLPYLKTIDRLQGTLVIEPNLLKTQSLKGNIQKSEFELSGSILGFQNPEGDIRLHLKTKLEDILSIIGRDFQGVSLEGEGPTEINAQFKGPLLSLSTVKVQAFAQLQDVSLKTNKFPEGISKLSGQISYEENLLKWKNLKGTVLDASVESDGEITDLTKPTGSLTLKAMNIDLTKIRNSFPAFFDKYGISPSGKSSGIIHYVGALTTQEGAQIAWTLNPEGISLKTKKIPWNLSNISGKITGSSDSMVLKDIQGVLNNENFTLNGQISNFKEPHIEATMSSGHMELKGQGQLKDKNLTIASLKGHYFNSSFAFKGEINLLEDKRPYLDLLGDINLDLADLPSLAPSYKDTFLKMNPAGKISVKGSVRGNSEDWRSLDIAFDATSPEIKSYGYQAQGVAWKYLQQNRNVDPCTLTAGFYGGNVKIGVTTDLTKNNLPFLTHFTLENTDLSLLKKDTKWNSEDISGLLNLSFTGNGELINLKTIEGNGGIAVTEGHLGKLNLLEGLGKFLFIPEFENITFNEVKGDFKVAEEKATTDNLYLKSEQVVFFCRGSVAFGGNLSMSIFSQFSQETILNSPSLKKVLTGILTQTDNYLTIKLSGTLQDPKYTVVPSSVDMLQRTTGIILDGIRSIFE